MYIVISLLTDFLMHGHRYMYFVTFSTCGHFIYISLPQPKMYQKIAKHEQIMKKYADVLKSDNVVSEEDYAVSLQHFLRKVKNNRPIITKQLVRGRLHESFTGVCSVLPRIFRVVVGF